MVSDDYIFYGNFGILLNKTSQNEKFLIKWSILSIEKFRCLKKIYK